MIFHFTVRTHLYEHSPEKKNPDLLSKYFYTNCYLEVINVILLNR